HARRCGVIRIGNRRGGGPASCTPAPESLTTVASFRTWRDLQAIVAGEPTEPPWTLRFRREGRDWGIIAKLAERAGFEPAKRFEAVYTLSRRAPSTTRTPLRSACSAHPARAGRAGYKAGRSGTSNRQG